MCLLRTWKRENTLRFTFYFLNHACTILFLTTLTFESYSINYSPLTDFLPTVDYLPSFIAVTCTVISACHSYERRLLVITRTLTCVTISIHLLSLKRYQICYCPSDLVYSSLHIPYSLTHIITNEKGTCVLFALFKLFVIVNLNSNSFFHFSYWRSRFW
jgi:hypothetical protein